MFSLSNKNKLSLHCNRYVPTLYNWPLYVQVHVLEQVPFNSTELQHGEKLSMAIIGLNMVKIGLMKLLAILVK